MLLALILKYKEKQEAEAHGTRYLPTLVVAPLSLIAQWGETFREWLRLSRVAARFQPEHRHPALSMIKSISAMDPRLDTGGWLTLTESHY